ncbi:MAG: hypothetical protein R3B09_05135 [Nannocystaceae bacterium]
MRPAHRSKLLVPEGDLEDLALLHCEWALGLDRFAALREPRLALGVPPNARPSDLLGERGGRWVFRFSLPAEDGNRTSVVRISALNDGVVVEHLVVREGPRERLQPSADSPETVRVILDMPGVKPAALRGAAPLVVGERDVPAIVADALELHREAPLVLVSVDNATREPLVSPTELARRLAGMALVVSLSTVGASRRLKDELLARGFSDKFGCFHGGVRILWPGINRHDDPYDHLLILPVRLYGIHERIRTERIAGVFCEMIAEDEDLRAWLREVDPATPRADAPPPAPRASHARMVLASPSPAARASERAGQLHLRERCVEPPASRSHEPEPESEPDPRPARVAPRATAVAPEPAVVEPATALASEEGCDAPEGEASTSAATSDASATNEASATSEAEAPPRGDAATGEASDEATSVAAEAPLEGPRPGAARADALADDDDLADDADDADDDDDLARAEPLRQRPPPRRADTTWSRLAADVVAAADLADELERDLEATRRELMETRKAQRRAEQERDEAVEARFAAASVADALALAESCFSSRLVVLQSARASAGDSPYRDPGRIFEVLSVLALFGRHDGEFEAALQKAMGAQARWRPKDGPETSSRFGAQRTWAGSDGERKLYRRHITVGHGVDPQRCAQIYYDIAGDGRVELAWVGEHRPTVSEDT